MLHNSPGGTLNRVAGNANVCLSCHVPDGQASARPLAAGDGCGTDAPGRGTAAQLGMRAADVIVEDGAAFAQSGRPVSRPPGRGAPEYGGETDALPASVTGGPLMPVLRQVVGETLRGLRLRQQIGRAHV